MVIFDVLGVFKSFIRFQRKFGLLLFFFFSMVHFSFLFFGIECMLDIFCGYKGIVVIFLKFIGLFCYYSSNRGVFHLFQALGGGYFCHFLAFRRYFGNFDVLGVFRSFFMFRGCISLFLGVECVLDIFLSF